MSIRPHGNADADGRAAYRRRLHRRALPWSIGMLFVSWPIPLLTGLLLYRLGDLVAPWVAFAVPALWLVCGFVRVRMSACLPVALGFDHGPHPAIPRKPTAAEAEALDPAWRDTLRTIGLAEGTYSVWVRESPGPLGAAHPAGLVIVSAQAVREFTSLELRGLLGHEIGHLVGDGGGAWYRLSWRYGGLLRMCFGVVGQGASWPTRRWPRLRTTAVAIAQLGVLIGLVVLLHLQFGTAVAVALLVAAAAQMGLQRVVLRRNQYNADRVSVDLGGGPGMRALVLRLNQSAHLFPRHYHPLWARVVLRCMDVLLSDPTPDRRLAALEARMREHDRPES